MDDTTSATLVCSAGNCRTVSPNVYTTGGTTFTTGTVITSQEIPIMSCNPEQYAWAGFNFLLYAAGIAVLLGMGLLVTEQVVSWIRDSAKARREELKAMRPVPASTKKSR